MEQNEQINNISHLDSLWGGTLVPIPDFFKYTAEEALYSAQSLGIAILGLLIFLVFFGKFFLKLISKMGVSFLYPRDVMKIKEENNLNLGFSFLFLIACPIFVSLLIRYEVLSSSYFSEYSLTVNALIFSLFPLVFFTLRKCLLFTMGAVINQSEDFAAIFKYSVSFFIMIVLLCLVPLPFTFLVTTPNFLVVRIILLSIIGMLTIAYFFQIGRIIISSQSSIFFSFLYLCTIEFLPLVLMTYTTINLK